MPHNDEIFLAFALGKQGGVHGTGAVMLYTLNALVRYCMDTSVERIEWFRAIRGLYPIVYMVVSSLCTK